MKNNDNLFSDFIALAVMAGIEKSISENKSTDKSQSETKTAEKKCGCGNNCKNTSSDSHKKHLLSDIDECLEMLTSDKFITNERLLLIINTLKSSKKYIA